MVFSIRYLQLGVVKEKYNGYQSKFIITSKKTCTHHYNQIYVHPPQIYIDMKLQEGTDKFNLFNIILYNNNPYVKIN